MLQHQEILLNKITEYLQRELDNDMNIKTLSASEIVSRKEVISKFKYSEGTCAGLSILYSYAMNISEIVSNKPTDDINSLRIIEEKVRTSDEETIFTREEKMEIENLISNIILYQTYVNELEPWLGHDDLEGYGQMQLSTVFSDTQQRQPISEFNETIIFTKEILVKKLEQILFPGTMFFIGSSKTGLSGHMMSIYKSKNDGMINFYDPNLGESQHNNIQSLVEKIWISGVLDPKLGFDIAQKELKKFTINIFNINTDNHNQYPSSEEFKINLEEFINMAGTFPQYLLYLVHHSNVKELISSLGAKYYNNGDTKLEDFISMPAQSFEEKQAKIMLINFMFQNPQWYTFKSLLSYIFNNANDVLEVNETQLSLLKQFQNQEIDSREFRKKFGDINPLTKFSPIILEDVVEITNDHVTTIELDNNLCNEKDKNLSIKIEGENNLDDVDRIILQPLSDADDQTTNKNIFELEQSVIAQTTTQTINTLEVSDYSKLSLEKALKHLEENIGNSQLASEILLVCKKSSNQFFLSYNESLELVNLITQNIASDNISTAKTIIKILNDKLQIQLLNLNNLFKIGSTEFVEFIINDFPQFIKKDGLQNVAEYLETNLGNSELANHLINLCDKPSYNSYEIENTLKKVIIKNITNEFIDTAKTILISSRSKLDSNLLTLRDLTNINNQKFTDLIFKEIKEFSNNQNLLDILDYLANNCVDFNVAKNLVENSNKPSYSYSYSYSATQWMKNSVHNIIKNGDIDIAKIIITTLNNSGVQILSLGEIHDLNNSELTDFILYNIPNYSKNFTISSVARYLEKHTQDEKLVNDLLTNCKLDTSFSGEKVITRDSTKVLCGAIQANLQVGAVDTAKYIIKILHDNFQFDLKPIDLLFDEGNNIFSSPYDLKEIITCALGATINAE